MKTILQWILWILTPKKCVYYINGTDELPAPLSVDEERELIERVKNDPNDLAFRNRLIEHNLRLVVYIAKKFENTAIPTEDLVSIGTIGLVKAVNSYKPEKNIKLATYASRCIENEILMYIRKTTQQKREISIDEPLNTDGDGNELLWGDILESEGGDVNRNLEEKEDRRLIRDAVLRLPPRDRQIIVMRFGLNGHKEQTQKQVADLLNISQSYISRLEKKIIQKLKKDILS